MPSMLKCVLWLASSGAAFVAAAPAVASLSPVADGPSRRRLDPSRGTQVRGRLSSGTSRTPLAWTGTCCGAQAARPTAVTVTLAANHRLVNTTEATVRLE